MNILSNLYFPHQDLFFVLYQPKLVWQLIQMILLMEYMITECITEDRQLLGLQEMMGLLQI